MARRWLVAAVLLLALGACGDEPEAEPATVPVPAISSDPPGSARPTVSSSRSTATQAAARPGRAAPASGADRSRADPAGFVALVQRELPGMAVDRRDEEIAALAQQTCADLAAGRSPGAVLTAVRTFGADRADARKLVRLAVGTVCPAQAHRTGE